MFRKLLKQYLEEHQVHAMARTSAEDPLRGYKFRISIPGLPSSCGFKKIGGLKDEMGVIEYDEGGYDHTHKLKGKAKGGQLTCEKGMFPSKQVEEVFRNSLASDDDRCTIVVALLDAKGNVARDWKLAECWCSAWEAGDLDASSEDVLVETITIQYEYFLD